MCHIRNNFSRFIFKLSQIFPCYDNEKPHSINTNLFDCDGFCCLGTVWNTDSCSDNLQNFSQSSCRHSPEDIIL